MRRLEDKLDRIAAAIGQLGGGGGFGGSSSGGSGFGGSERANHEHCASAGDVPNAEAPRARARKRVVESPSETVADAAIVDTDNEDASIAAVGSPTRAARDGRKLGRSGSHSRFGEDIPTLTSLSHTLALVAKAVGVPDTEEDSSAEERRRLKEKLKTAMESGTRQSVRHIETGRETWTEYIFGICKPDGRVGKAGSRHWPDLLSTYLLVSLNNGHDCIIFMLVPSDWVVAWQKQLLH